MKVHRFGLLLLLALTIGLSLVVVSGTLARTLARPPALTAPADTLLSLSTLNSASAITITTTGFTPTVLTTTVGAEVRWYNATDTTHVLQSGQPRRFFLPIVWKNASGKSATGLGNDSGPLPPDLTLTGGDIFSATLPPGGVFTHTFSLTGAHPFFLATAPQFSGQVIVQATSAPGVILSAAPSSGTVPLTVLFTANASQTPGQVFTYTWDFGDGITETVAMTTTGPVTASRFYPIVGLYTATVTVSDSLASASAQQLIAVNEAQPNLPPDPATIAPPLDLSVATNLFDASEFLYSGANPIQTGVAPGTIEMRRVAVLRGRVLTRAGDPLPGVTITVHDQPEFGQTLSRADGMFDLAVNGGGLLTLHYDKPGYLPVQRQVEAPWQDYAWLPEVVLIPFDKQVTTINLAAADFQVAQGSVISDADGVRQATLLFPPGTQAEITLPNGMTQTLTSLNVRVTEYTVGDNGPEIMPAELPPQSGYTYAVELSADEAVANGLKINGKDVWLNQPVFFYVNNFLDFPVGNLVPMGYYDNDRALWVPSDNGRIIKILSHTNGLADLDVDGSGQPANAAALAALSLTDAERQRLAGLYAPGQSLWRVPLTHLSTWDANWGWWPPPGAVQPNNKMLRKNQPEDDPDCQGGSIIECQNQILGEALPVGGTPFSLHYRSDRVVGHIVSHSLEIPLTGEWVPGILRNVELEIYTGGRSFIYSLPPAPNLSYTFTWDSRDAYGRIMQGRQPVVIRIGYTYHAFYSYVPRFGYNGNGIPITGNRARQTVTLWQELTRWYVQQISVNFWDTRTQGLGGWSLTPHHAYDPVGKVLYLGNGERRSAEAIGPVIATMAGNGGISDSGDGGPALQAGLNDPTDVLVAPDGSFFIAEGMGRRVRRVDPNGNIATVAGGGNPPDGLGDGGPATQAQLSWVYNIALGPDGSLYVSDTDHYRVRRVGPDGIITTVAGNGTPGNSGDGGPATEARLTGPAGIFWGPDGSLYISDWDNHNVRRVGPDGIITTVAGGGNPPDDLGDGGPATEAQLILPREIALGSDGSLYIVEGRGGNDCFNLVRRVGPDGIITTVAGSLVPGNPPYVCPAIDGILATSANLQGLSDIELGPDGSLYLSQGPYQPFGIFGGGPSPRIRRVWPDGLITTVAGSSSSYGYGGDGGPPAQAHFSGGRMGLDLAPDGNLYIADGFNYVRNVYGSNRIRRISPVLLNFSATDIIIPSEDGAELYAFDPRGRHKGTVNTLTGALIYRFDHDNAGRLTRITDGDGNITTIERDANGNPTAIIGPYGQRTGLAVNADGYLTNLTNPANEPVNLTYEGGGLLATLTNPRGQVQYFSYDSMGRLRRDSDAAGGFMALTRSDTHTDNEISTVNGYIVTLTTALSRTTTYRVENLITDTQRRINTFPDGMQTSEQITPNGSRTTILADGTVIALQEGPDPRWGMQAPLPQNQTMTTPGGLVATLATVRTATLADPNNPMTLTSQTDTVSLNGRPYTSVYNVASRTFSETTPAGRQSTIVIDALGRPAQMQVAGLDPTSFTYDARGRLDSATQGSGAEARTITFSYNSEGYLATLTDPLSRTVSFSYDLAGRVTQQTLPDGRVIGYGYDANGNLTSLTPPDRPPHSFSYTPVDLTEVYTPPNLGAGAWQTLYTYNADRQLDFVTRPDGLSVDLGYDSAGRLSALTTPRGATTYGYQPTSGNLATITTPEGGSLAYTYDGSLPLTETWAGAVSGVVSRTYDNDFRVTSTGVNGGITITFQYDNDSLLTGAGNLSLSRNPQNGLLTGTTLGSVADTWSYNGFGEPVNYSATISGTAGYAVQYSRDSLGRIETKTETIGGGTMVYSYTYDLAGRLSEVWQNGVLSSTYTYDDNGNRLSLTTSGGTVSGSYDDQDRLTQYGATTYTYTANGELLSKTTGVQTTTYQYDALGNLMAVTLPDDTQIEYIVDGTNRRIGKRVNGVLVQGFLYENQLNPIAELDGSGNIVSRFVYASRANAPDYIIRGGATYRLIADHLGSPRLVVDVATGAVVQRMDYDEFGNVILDTNPGFQPFGFAGGLYDQHTRLTRFGARDYDAETGRWTAKDPILFAGGDANLYGYVVNNPVKFTDPTGLMLDAQCFQDCLSSHTIITDSISEGCMGKCWKDDKQSEQINLWKCTFRGRYRQIEVNWFEYYTGGRFNKNDRPYTYWRDSTTGKYYKYITPTFPDNSVRG
jgi:RHS repeat-associated protein